MSEMQPLELQMASNPEAAHFVFPAYWGGMVVSKRPPQIHEGMRNLRRAVGSLAAKKQQGGPQFPVRSAKELMQKLAEALDELSMQAFPIAQEVTHFDTKDIPSNSTASGKPVFRTLAHVKSTVRVGAADGSYVDVVGSGHGGDVDDKAGGKADTYAWKSALLKGLCVPEQDMPDTDDESSDMQDAANAPTAKAKRPETKAEYNVRTGTTRETVAVDLAALEKQVLSSTNEELDALKAKIMPDKTGKVEIELSMPEKLRLSAAFQKRRAENDATDKAAKESK